VACAASMSLESVCLISIFLLLQLLSYIDVITDVQGQIDSVIDPYQEYIEYI